MALALVLPGLLLGGLAALVYSALMAGWDEGGQWNPTFRKRKQPVGLKAALQESVGPDRLKRKRTHDG